MNDPEDSGCPYCCNLGGHKPHCKVLTDVECKKCCKPVSCDELSQSTQLCEECQIEALSLLFPHK